MKKYFIDLENGRVSNERNETVAVVYSMSIEEAKEYLIDSGQIESDADLQRAQE